MGPMETVTLINRTKGTLQCTFDGHTYDLVPGENHGFPKVAVPFAKRQNPVMGSEDPYNPIKFNSLVGVKDTSDPVTPIKQTDAVERIDRSKVRGMGRKARVMEGDPASAFEARVSHDADDVDNEAAATQG
jgi:hypothetical protein